MASALAVEAPFAPRKRLRVDGWRVVTLLGLASGGAVMLLGALLLAGKLGSGALAIPSGRGIDLIAIGFLVAAGPAALAHARRQARRDALDERLPDFLSDVAALHKAGMTLAESIVTAAGGSYGPLDVEVQRAADQVKWNLPVVVALENFARRLDSALARRTMTVVLEAARIGGNVPEVLDIAASNARAEVTLRQERERSMGLYVIITYVAGLVFVGVALAMQGVFVPKMVAAFSKNAKFGSAAGLAQLPSAEQFRLLFYVSALAQSVGNGLIGGLMTQRNPLAGLKHSCAMVALCVAGFLLAP